MESNKYKDMLLELLSLEEKNDIFNLTREKRFEFQNYIKKAIRIMEQFPSVQERIADMEPEAFMLVAIGDFLKKDMKMREIKFQIC